MKFHLNADVVVTHFVPLITYLKIINVPGFTPMNTSPITNIAEIVGVNYQEYPINVTSAEWSFVIIAGCRRIMDVK